MCYRNPDFLEARSERRDVVGNGDLLWSMVHGLFPMDKKMVGPPGIEPSGRKPGTSE